LGRAGAGTCTPEALGTLDVTFARSYQRLLGGVVGSGAPTAKVLGQQPGAAGGRPEAVCWLTRLLALEQLGKSGTAAERGIVELFAHASSGYEVVRIKYHGRTGKEPWRAPTKVFFATLAQGALEKMPR
jgi:hypothetical protein